MIVVLVLRPQGLFARRSDDGRADDRQRKSLAARAPRWRWPEIAFWLVAFGRAVLLPRQAPDPERDRDPRAVRALARPDPRLCRHRLARATPPSSALGAYAAACSPSTSRGDPLVGPRRRRSRAAALLGFAHQLPGAARQRPHAADGDARRRADPLRVANQLRLAHRRRRRPAGRRDGAAPRAVRVRPLRPHRLCLQPGGAVPAVPAGAARRAFALRPVAAWRSATTRCAPRRSACRCIARLVAIYTLAAAYAGVAGALLAQTTQLRLARRVRLPRSADVLLVLVIGGAG